MDHNFTIVGGDTDSIMFCKPDGADFSKEEQQSLLAEINALLPEYIKFEHDGMFSRVLYLRAKNYIMIDDKGKRKVKGSALKASTLEPACKEMLLLLVDCLMEDRRDDMKAIYLSYVKELKTGITDIRRWCKKMQLSPTTFNSKRTNETKVVDAIAGTDYKSGDRIYVYVTDIDTLCLTERYNGLYNMEHYMERLYKVVERFAMVMDIKAEFPNFALKRNKKLLETI
jgi:DNA polymerase elongation subunit (family B)